MTIQLSLLTDSLYRAVFCQSRAKVSEKAKRGEYQRDFNKHSRYSQLSMPLLFGTMRKITNLHDNGQTRRFLGRVKDRGDDR